MMCKRMISVVLTAALLFVGLGGCGIVLQSIPESSAVSAVLSESGSSVETSSSVESAVEQTGPVLKSMTVQPVTELKDSAVSKLDRGITALDFSMYTGTLNINDICFFDGGLIGVLSYDKSQDLSDKRTELNFILTVFSVFDMKPLYQVIFTTQTNAGMDFIKNGENKVLVLSHYVNWLADETFFSVTETGVTEIPRDQVYGHRLSDSVTILEDKNNLVLEQNGETKILLSGFYYTDPNTVDDIHDWEGYSFCLRLDDTHFVYEKYGWEWTEYTGIYDIEKDETIVLTYGNEKNFGFCTADGKQIVLGPDRSDGFVSYGPYLYDAAINALTDLNWFDFSDQDEIFPSFFLTGNTLVSFIPDSSELRLFDLKTKTEKSPMSFNKPYDLSDSVVDFMISGKYLYFYSSSWTYDSFLFRIPVEEVIRNDA